MMIKDHEWLLYGMLAGAAGEDNDQWELAILMEGDAINAHTYGHGPYKKFCIGDDLMFRYLHTNREKPMSKQKLDQEMRDNIVTRALRDFKPDEKAALAKDIAAFGDIVYNHTFSEHESIVRSLPECWYDMREDIVIDCSGFGRKYGKGGVEGLDEALPLSVPRPLPKSESTPDVYLTADHALMPAAKQLVQRHQDLRAEEKALSRRLQDLLAKCRTVKQLQEQWPEGMRYLQEHADESGPQMQPSVVREINEALGIK